ncbi:NUDIX domain-containing protein [Nocardioides sp. J2M5]|uniref:NUDIX domain-containing protein n=1 Tax=Nocardioides palaemonis TaxID=2829810 RepID=UPI001BAA5C64|nr:NUDIX domain-containing protein [Nocardioides palaemonis]MBS2939495.1 NUDIX domain-containing protein [Nocardioides palaemonis]
MGSLPRRQRVAAYAVVLRERAGAVQILLSRLAPRISRTEMWTLPGGGVDHGEDPRDALIREIHEETGLAATIGERARVYSAHMPRAPRDGQLVDAHAIRIVYDGWVAPDAPDPRVVEVDGSTVDAAWLPLADVLAGRVPVTASVADALEDHRPFRLQRVAAYAVVRRDRQDGPAVLLTRLSARAAHPGRWTLPGGGIDHGEPPARALAREVEEECGLACEVGELLDVHDTHFEGTAPSGRIEDFHGIHLLFRASVADGEPRVLEQDGTTDAVAWVAVRDVEAGAVEVLDVVRHALRLDEGDPA